MWINHGLDFLPEAAGITLEPFKPDYSWIGGFSEFYRDTESLNGPRIASYF